MKLLDSIEYVVSKGIKTEAALKAALVAAKSGDVITLEDDIALTSFVNINTAGNIELNLNDHNIIRENGTALYINNADTTLTIKGEGTITGEQVVYANHGTVNIMSGNYVSNCKCENNACPTIYVQGSAKVNIRGGKFSAKQNKSDFSKPQNTCLNLNDEATGMITVYGGSFENFNPADNVAEGAGTNFVASGCKVTSSVIEGITIWTVN